MAEKNNALEHQHMEHSAKGLDLHQVGKWGAIAIIAYYLLTEHRAHVFQFLPYLFLLACPLMHIFMHGGHKHNHHDKRNSDDNKEQQ